jgi:NitT/TauT family transport system substrate-binding protein
LDTRVARWAAISLALLFVAGACGSDDDGEAATATTTKNGPEMITVEFPGFSFTGSTGVLVQYMKDEGMEEEHGIKLDLRIFSTTDEPQQALANGAMDVGFFPLLAWAKLKAEGRNVDLLSGLLVSTGTAVVRKDSPYRTLADLKGKKVGSLPAGSGIYNDMAILAQEQGLDWEKDFEHVAAPPPALVGLMETGQVESIVIYDPSPSKLLATGNYRVLLNTNDEWKKLTGDNMQSYMLAARGGWAKENPEAARRLIALFADGIKRIAGKPEVTDRYQKLLNLTDAELAVARTRLPKDYTTSTPAQVEAECRKVLEKGAEVGVIPSAPKPVLTKV